MDRRRAVRRLPSIEEPLSRMRLRAGREVIVLDVSSTGALVEGETRLLPGTHIEVHVVTPTGRRLVRSRVVRSWVSAVSPAGVRYRAGLAFERQVDASTPTYS